MGTSERTPTDGQKVTYESAHHAHNADLQRLLGEVGTVVGRPDANGKVLVRFCRFRYSGEWWIHPRHLYY